MCISFQKKMTVGQFVIGVNSVDVRNMGMVQVLPLLKQKEVANISVVNTVDDPVKGPGGEKREHFLFCFG
jgi:hypothetical protein